jgi:cobalt/nickel transport system permease protein
VGSRTVHDAEHQLPLEAAVHIPDGYLSPQTSAVFGVTMLPLWYQASRRVQAVVKTRYVPLVALGAAFSFVVMMFNVPVPNGTTAHAVGAALVAVLLGPWAACVAVSTALLIQALFFGDGGILAYPANAFNMAVVMPFLAYGIYRLLARHTGATSARRPVAAAVAGYVGINAAALATAVEFGLQPGLFHTADGTPLYAPFHLAQAVPAMMVGHLAVAGVVEAMLTGGVIAYLQRANLPLLRINEPDRSVGAAGVSRRRVRPFTAGLVATGVTAALTPLGLLAPGGAFGEDAPGDLDLGRYGLSAVPSGLQHYSAFWGHALLPGYGDGGWQYALSALIGIAAIGLVVAALTWLLRRLRGGDEVTHADAPADSDRVGTP